MKSSNFVKGDCRKHGPLTSKPYTCRVIGKKQGYTEAATGPNRHPGYPTMGAYDRTGGRLASPKR